MTPDNLGMQQFSKQRRLRPVATVLLGALGYWVNLQSAAAQTVSDVLPVAIPGFAVAPGVTVLSRLHQNDAAAGLALGINSGNLTMYPSLTTGMGVDTAPAIGHAGSIVVEVQPSVRITDATLGLVAFAGGTINRYQDDNTADTHDISTGLGFAVPVGEGTLTLGAARVSTQENALGSVQAGSIAFGAVRTATAAPFGVSVTEGRAALRLPLGSFDTTTRFAISSSALSAVRSTLPPPFGQRTDFRASGEITTADAGVLQGLTRASVSSAQYAGVLPGSGLANASSFGLVGGVETTANAVLRVRAVAGFVHQQFAGNVNPSGTIVIGSIGLGWTPDGLLSAELDASRDAGTNTTLGTQGSPVTTLHAALANAFTRDSVISASLDARTGLVAGHQAREIDSALDATLNWSRRIAFTASLSDVARFKLPGVAPHEARLLVSVTWTP